MLSIVIPVFNSEKTISVCLESIFNDLPTFQYEIIAINDGSSDNSLEILETFQKKYVEKIKIITQENRGVSEARNQGIKEASGEWLMFVDSDDFLSKGWSKIIEKHLKTENQFVIFSKEKIETKDFKQIIKMITGLNPEGHLSCIWSKLYLTEKLKKEKIKFHTDIINGEDILFNLEYYMKIKNITFINENIYNYYINSYSATNRYNKNFLSSDVMYQKELLSLLNLMDENELKDISKISVLNAWLVFFNRYSYKEKYDKNDLKQLIGNSEYMSGLRELSKYSNYFSKSKRILLKLIDKGKYKLVFYLFKIKNLIKNVKEDYRIERI